MGPSSLSLPLFGPPEPWDIADWIQVDDSIRGGISYSNLSLSSTGSYVTFSGNVNTKILGAGFASQRTASNMLQWDLSPYDAIELELQPCSCSRPKQRRLSTILLGKKEDAPCVHEKSEKTFTFVIKDNILPKDEETGREKSGIVWERDFIAVPGYIVRLMLDDFRPFYRGKLVEKDGLHLKRDTIRRFSIMFRSHFGQQDGDFKLKIHCIRAVKLSE